MRRTPAPVPPPVRRRRRWTATVLAVPALLAGTALTVPGAATAAPAAWTPKPAPMTTPWTNQVPVDNPLPEQRLNDVLPHPGGGVFCTALFTEDTTWAVETPWTP